MFKSIIMKKFLLIIFTIGLAFSLNAQGLKYGPIAGATVSKIIEKSDLGYDFKKSNKYGYQIGFAVEYDILNTVYVGASLSYLTKGDKYKDNFVTSKINFGNFELPIKVGYVVPIGNFRISGNVGSYTSISVVGNRNFIPIEGVVPPFEWNFEDSPHQLYVADNSEIFGDEWNSFKRFDAGISFGVKLDFKNYNLALNYSHGFIDIRPDETITAKSSVFNLMFFYVLNYY